MSWAAWRFAGRLLCARIRRDVEQLAELLAWLGRLVFGRPDPPK